MQTLSLERIGESMRHSGHYLTSYGELGVPLNEQLVNEVVNTAPQNLKRPVESDIPREARAVSEACRAAAKRLMAPLVEFLFDGENEERAKARRNWFIFGVNYYQTGWILPRHRDLNTPEAVTVVIASLTGVRDLTVWDSQGERTIHRMAPRSIMLLDGVANPEHMAACVEGASISVVADVPEVMYDLPF